MSLSTTTLDEIAPKFDAFLIDQFGVLLNGEGAYAFAPAALQKLASMNKQIVLLSNSGKRAQSNNDRLVKHGFDRNSFQTVLSSGEVAYRYLNAQIGKTIEPNSKVLLLARDQDTSAIDGLSLRLANGPDDADLILLAGSRGDEMRLEVYAEMLKGPAARGISCICTNPDVTMMTPVGTRFGAGTIAKTYEDLGGSVHWIGKPHRMIYDAALDMLGQPDAGSVLCIGDSPAHDIAGGKSAGLSTALVRTGIHANETDLEVEEDCRRNGFSPDYVLTKFSFSD